MKCIATYRCISEKVTYKAGQEYDAPCDNVSSCVDWYGYPLWEGNAGAPADKTPADEAPAEEAPAKPKKKAAKKGKK